MTSFLIYSQIRFEGEAGEVFNSKSRVEVDSGALDL